MTLYLLSASSFVKSLPIASRQVPTASDQRQLHLPSTTITLTGF